MNKNIVLNDLQRICFFDIETVGQKIDIENNQVLREFVGKKEKTNNLEECVTNETILKQGGLLPELGKIVCISVGVFKGSTFYVKSFYGDDEKDLLMDFVKMLESDNFTFKYVLCGQNIESFDIPFIAKRCIINGIRLPDILNIMTKKQWDYNFIDTMQLWAFGDSYNNRVSLKVLCETLNVPTSKDDIDGSKVSEVYYNEGEEGLKRIKKYCEKDVIATARVFQRITQNGYLEDSNIVIR
jgi:predicted PolB exonuclease-like 3'-5' exonuclease